MSNPSGINAGNGATPEMDFFRIVCVNAECTNTFRLVPIRGKRPSPGLCDMCSGEYRQSLDEAPKYDRATFPDGEVF